MYNIDEGLKLGLIVDEIVGVENDTIILKYKSQNSKVTLHNDVSILNEETIKEMAEHLKIRYPKDLRTNSWYPFPICGSDDRRVSLRVVVDTLIDNYPDRWMGPTGRYVYSESDRQRIMQKCAERTARRLQKYAKNNIVQYKIFATGEVGFRYE